MIYDENDCVFTYKTNSLLSASLTLSVDESEDVRRAREGWPSYKILNNLGVISGLYIYTNTPPVAYGTPAPKVAESVQRAYMYNRKPADQKFREIGPFKVSSNYWQHDSGQYPFNQITGNWAPSEAYHMMKAFLIKYHGDIIKIADQVITRALTQNSDLLTKGRQTWCPITHKSIPSSRAYNEACEFYRDNLGRSSSCALEWVQMFFESMNLTSIKHKRMEYKVSIKRVYDRASGAIVKRATRLSVVSKSRTQGVDKVRKYMMDMSRSFCSYLKHLERGKRSRRAIASASMFMRMFLHIVEDFHLELGKVIEGSTISIGGEEKKVKIISNLNSASLSTSSSFYSLQATQDATKFNECVSPEAFAFMHMMFFDEKLRDTTCLPKVTLHEKILKYVALSAHFMQACKRITLGDGVMLTKENIFNRPSWNDITSERLNRQTRAWYDDLKSFMEPPNYVNSSCGMLMGMLNATSTTLGCCAVMYRMDTNRMKVVTLRSSDDSMTIYVADTPQSLKEAIYIENSVLKTIGINLSPDKSFIFPAGYGEYTSWFQDGSFVAQYGVETSSLRPQGKNPPDDFRSIAKGTAVSQQLLEVNPIGAAMKLRIGVDNVRRLWRIAYNPHKRSDISGKVLVMSDGGRCMWDSTNCHLEETSLKERWVTNDTEKDYLLRIRNPNSPFHGDVEEEIKYSVEKGCLVIGDVDTPRTAFHYLKRSNRTAKGPKHESNAMIERANTEALKILQHADITTAIRAPGTMETMASHVLNCIDAMTYKLEFTPEEIAEINRARDKIRGIESEEGDDSESGECDPTFGDFRDYAE